MGVRVVATTGESPVAAHARGNGTGGLAGRSMTAPGGDPEVDPGPPLAPPVMAPLEPGAEAARIPIPLELVFPSGPVNRNVVERPMPPGARRTP